MQQVLDNDLFSAAYLMNDLNNSLNSTEMARRKFRDIAVIAGMVFTGFPNKLIKSKHLQANSQLLFSVFRDYEPENLLFLPAFRETFEIFGEHFSMHPSGAMFWEEKQMLLVSDVHLGKISHFRKYGSAVPQNAIAQNFERLTAVVEHFQPSRICFLGDLFHSSLNLEWDLFEN